MTLLHDEYPNILRHSEPFDSLNSSSRNETLLNGVCNGIRSPFLVYIKGNISLLNADNTFAVVGTRKNNTIWDRGNAILTLQLVSQNFVIVSGLSFGVDAIVHTIPANNTGKTIAVLGCGVEC